MANRLKPGFAEANSRNMPTIDMFMVGGFIKYKDKFSAGEIWNGFNVSDFSEHRVLNNF